MPDSFPHLRVISAEPQPIPVVRRLRGYAFDPSLSLKLGTIDVNELVLKVPYEVELEPGPVGEYLEVIDFDPASNCLYQPVDLNHPHLLAQDGLDPSESNPQFHQQMVYAVAMTTIRNFEHATGLRALWRPHLGHDAAGQPRTEFVQRLRVYPHALRDANAYYSPAKCALLFGYFPARVQGGGGPVPGGTVFTCLSHDIVAHETAHALLDGYLGLLPEPTNPDSLAFHEAFADIVALFQHFSFPEVLRHQLAVTRGDLTGNHMLGKLAQQFGLATGRRGALRDAIGSINPATGQWERLAPDPSLYLKLREPHLRGAILVAAVFDAFLAIYEARSADLVRIATGGSGLLPEGVLNPDLVNRLAQEAARVAQNVLNICLRGLTYLPPVDFTFGDYLRAIITADAALIAKDEWNYRKIFVDSFSQRGIYPRDLRSLSIQNLLWPTVSQDNLEFFRLLMGENLIEVHWNRFRSTRVEFFRELAVLKTRFQDLILNLKKNRKKFEVLTGLDLNPLFGPENAGFPLFNISYLCPSELIGPGGTVTRNLSIALIQTRKMPIDPLNPESGTFQFRGGCTLIIDQESLLINHILIQPLYDTHRLEQKRQYLLASGLQTIHDTYFTGSGSGFTDEPFALLHNEF